MKIMNQTNISGSIETAKPQTFYSTDERQQMLWRSLPSELKALPNWVHWGYEWRKSANSKARKWTKIPYSPQVIDYRRMAAVDTPTTWGSLDAAVSACVQHRSNGIGFVLTESAEIIAVDLDHCRDEATGEIADWAQEVVERLDSYTEISPSGTGLRVLMAGELPEEITSVITGRKSGNKEIYWRGRYVTITGAVLEGRNTINERSAEALAWLTDVFPQPVERQIQSIPIDTPLAEDDEILEKASRARNGAKIQRLFSGYSDSDGYPSQSEADFALAGMLAFYAQDEAQLIRLFRRSGLYRPSKGEAYLVRTARNAMRNRPAAYAGRTTAKAGN